MGLEEYDVKLCNQVNFAVSVNKYNSQNNCMQLCKAIFYVMSWNKAREKTSKVLQ